MLMPQEKAKAFSQSKLFADGNKFTGEACFVLARLLLSDINYIFVT